MRHQVRHGLAPELARKAVQAAWESYQTRFAKYSPSATWTSDSSAKVRFVVPGATVEGRLEVGAEDVVIELDVPFLMRPFTRRAVEVIDREIRVWADKARAGELG